MTEDSFPSLLYTAQPGARTVPERAAKDVGLDALLPPGAVGILLAPASAEDISARQKLFELLRGRREDFCAFRNLLTALSQARDAFTNAQNDCERYFLFTAFAEKLGAAYGAAKTFAGLTPPEGDTLLRRFAGYMNAEKLSDSVEALRKAAAKARSAADTVALSRFTFTDRGVRLSPPGEEKTVSDRLRSCAFALGLPEPRGAGGAGNRITSAVSEALTRLWPEQILELDAFLTSRRDILDSPLTSLRAELDFYLAVDEAVGRGTAAGLPVCFPELAGSPELSGTDVCDVTLAAKHTIVPNDLFWRDGRRFCFLTGANGGGKTTYLRAACVNLLLALSGCPVFCRSMRVYPFKKVFTHFPDDERYGPSGGQPGGRLADEVKRMGEIIEASDGDTFVFLNETYSGADEAKGCALTLEAARTLNSRGAFGLYVTHFHEVGSTRGEPGFGVLGTAPPSADGVRSFKILAVSDLRRSFASDILRKYGLDAESLEKNGEPNKA